MYDLVAALKSAGKRTPFGITVLPAYSASSVNRASLPSASFRTRAVTEAPAGIKLVPSFVSSGKTYLPESFSLSESRPNRLRSGLTGDRNLTPLRLCQSAFHRRGEEA